MTALISLGLLFGSYIVLLGVCLFVVEWQSWKVER